MKKIGLLLLTFFCSFSFTMISELELLDSLKKDGKIDMKEYRLFKDQIAFKESVGIKRRLDSMVIWNINVIYTEEFYYPKKDYFLIKEYYFFSEKCAQQRNEKQLCFPDRYYENGILKSKYFFKDLESKEHLQSIEKHMKRRKILDNITPLAKVEVVHAGCSMSWKHMEQANEKANKKYRKVKTPDYYLIETLTENNNKMISFQRPIKTKFKVIVEGHSF